MNATATRTLVTRKGKSVTTPYSDAEAIDRLHRYLDNGTIKGDFPSDLYESWRKWGGLSPDRNTWVHVLVVEAENPPAPVVVNAAGLVELLDLAARKLRYPKIRLKTASGVNLKLSRAGDRAAKPGSINVVNEDKFDDDGRPLWLGRVTRDGTLEGGRLVHNAEVVALLSALGDSPADVAAKYGKVTGHCCFCCKPLNDDRSLTVGYGRTCAGHYGLPWGVHEAAGHVHDDNHDLPSGSDAPAAA